MQRTPERAGDARHPAGLQAQAGMPGIAPGTLFEKLPEDWVCPECGGRVTTYEVSDAELARTARDIEAYRGAGLRYEREIARLNDAVHDANAVAGRVSQRKEEVLVERVGREQDAAHTAYP